jgi:carboxypeptidase Taq
MHRQGPEKGHLQEQKPKSARSELVEEKLRELKTRLGEIEDFKAAAGVLEWDQMTYMPPRGTAARAEQLATLRKTAHALFVSDEIGRLLEELQAEVADLDYDSDEASLVRVTARDYERERKIPASLVAEMAKATALAQEAWVQARAESNYPHFQPHLQKIVELNIQMAEALGYKDRIYDALLDLYEPEMKTAQVARIFDELKAELVPLVRAIAEKKDAVDDAILYRDYDGEKQWAFGQEVLRQIGFDFERGRQDKSAHPFTTSFSINDVRLTTRVYRDQFKTALFGSIHEGGHALYEQGFSPALERTPLCDGASLGVHESQSRLWENLVGRSRGFWAFYFPRLKEFFPQQLDGLDLETFYKAINKVEPSMIRVEADEVTYNLHIFLRFEIENDMLEGKVKLSDLPKAWNAKMKAYLGIVPANDAEGVLQDIHWSTGTIGYFPTYALGTLLSVQFYNQALAEIPEIPAQVERGEFAPLQTWLKERIYVHGKKFTPAELVKRVTGSELSARPFVEYAKGKYGDIYGL